MKENIMDPADKTYKVKVTVEVTPDGKTFGEGSWRWLKVISPNNVEARKKAIHFLAGEEVAGCENLDS